MHCHGVCTRLLTRDKLFQTYVGREKDLCQDYEDDNQALKEGGGKGGVGRAAEGGTTASNKDSLALVHPSAPSSSNGYKSSSTPTPPDSATVLLLSQVVVFAGSSLAASSSPPSRGWWRAAEHWERRGDVGKPKARPPHLTRMMTDHRHESGRKGGREGGREGGGFCPFSALNRTLSLTYLSFSPSLPPPSLVSSFPHGQISDEAMPALGDDLCARERRGGREGGRGGGDVSDAEKK